MSERHLVCDNDWWVVNVIIAPVGYVHPDGNNMLVSNHGDIGDRVVGHIVLNPDGTEKEIPADPVNPDDE